MTEEGQEFRLPVEGAPANINVGDELRLIPDSETQTIQVFKAELSQMESRKRQDHSCSTKGRKGPVFYDVGREYRQFNHCLVNHRSDPILRLKDPNMLPILRGSEFLSGLNGCSNLMSISLDCLLG